MKIKPKHANAKDQTHLLLLTSAFLITFLLCFIDEGHYNFQWMWDWGNWIPFTVYMVAIFFGQLLFAELLLKRYRGPGKLLFSIIGGTVLGVTVVIFRSFTNW